jgi:hypothetical protein
MKPVFMPRPLIMAFLTLMLLLSLSAVVGADENLVGGIEIGGSGVKEPTVLRVTDWATLQIVDVSKDKDLGIGKLQDLDTSQLIKGAILTSRYDDTEIYKAGCAVGLYVLQLLGKGVPAKNIRILGSSGLPATRDHWRLKAEVDQAANRARIAAHAQDSIPGMEFITCQEEVEWTIAGLEPDESKRTGRLYVDVGTGNTKGGFVDEHGQTVMFCIPWGIQTYSDLVTSFPGGRHNN